MHQAPIESKPAGMKRPLGLVAAAILLAAPALGAQAPAGPLPPSSTAAKPPAPSSATPAAPAAGRGKKLVLKDGSVQLVREYHVEGDRLRFYSLDSSQWEEMPAALVDWDATKRIEADEAQRQAAILARAHVREEGLRAGPLDTDASMEVAPGVFLPPGEGLFVFDGKAVLPLTQALANSNLSKGKMAEKIFMPVPVVPTRHTISLPGIRASLRVNTTEPEFYMRTTDAREPQLRLIRARVRKDARQLENLDALYDQQRETGDTVPIQLWEIAQGVYRFTLGRPLEPGEYALAESIEGQDGSSVMSLYVWDFGVDANAGAAKGK
ncbi:MAG: hypothetical protein WA175_00400 [Candidatus Acidiferrales bacterium]